MIKASASSVVSNLAGSSHGHLDLFIPESEYTKIRGSAYTKPEYPSEFKIKNNTELHDVIILRELHNKKLQLFLEMLAIESVLKSQITASIDSIYLKELKNTTTETIRYTIPYIFTYLFQQYGQVSTQ